MVMNVRIHRTLRRSVMGVMEARIESRNGLNVIVETWRW